MSAKCSKCGSNWGVYTTPAPSYPLGMISHYCLDSRFVCKEPTTDEEFKVISVSDSLSRINAAAYRNR